MTDATDLSEHHPQLIVALDVASLEEERFLVQALRPAVVWFKVGLELFTAEGPAAVALVQAAGGRVFLDLKVHDIPQTTAGAVRSAARLGANMLTVHLTRDDRAAAAAVEAARASAGAPFLIGVYRLTSEPAGPTASWTAEVAEAARRAADLGFDGVITAVGDVAAVRAAAPPGFLTVSPGIRPEGAAAADQVRAATPDEAARGGTDFVVVGRPITHSADPAAAAQEILAQMRRARETPARRAPVTV